MSFAIGAHILIIGCKAFLRHGAILLQHGEKPYLIRLS